jgi:hypothetical protein
MFTCMNLPLTFYMEFRIKKNTEFRGIIQNSAKLNSRKVKSLPQKIPYSTELQKVTSINTTF